MDEDDLQFGELDLGDEDEGETPGIEQRDPSITLHTSNVTKTAIRLPCDNLFISKIANLINFYPRVIIQNP